MEFLDEFEGFEWDRGNKDKNWEKHEVSNAESEEIFFNLPLLVQPDTKHSSKEARYYVLGRTNPGRLLFVVFTPRRKRIRIICARDMKKRKGGFTMNRKRRVPKFKNEDEEREFWSKHDSADFIDYKKGKRFLFPNLKPSVKTISIRMSESLLDSIKLLANKKDVPYQSLVKMILSDRVRQELQLMK